MPGSQRSVSNHRIFKIIKDKEKNKITVMQLVHLPPPHQPKPLDLKDQDEHITRIIMLNN